MIRSTVATVGTAGTVGIAAGTQPATTTGIIPEQQAYEQTVTGFWLHIGQEVDPIEAGVADSCELVSWSNDETLAYDAQLIDRSADPRQTSVTLYLHERVEINPGDLFIVNDRETCESGYVGVELEQLGMDLETLAARDVTPASADEAAGTDRPAQTTSGNGPGFGVVSALAGLAGAGWLVGRQSDH